MKLIITIAILSVCFSSIAQIYDTNGDFVETYAGSGFSGHVDGVGQETMFQNPNSIVADSFGNLFVLDGNGSLIRKITTNLTVSTFAGGGTQETANGTNATLKYGGENQIAIDHSGILWTVGVNGFLIRIDTGANVSSTLLNGTTWPWGICVDSKNNLYISDYLGNVIWQYNTSGVLSVFAGSGNAGYADGNGIFTDFHYPTSLAIDAADNIYVWDSDNYRIRKIDQNQNVTTLAGTGASVPYKTSDGFGTNASFYPGIYSMAVDDSGNLIVTCGNCIQKISPTTNVVTIAGSFTQSGYMNGAGNIALFNAAENSGQDFMNGVCVSQGTIYVADCSNQRICSITNNPVPQMVSGANMSIKRFAGITISGIVGRTYEIQASPDMNTWTTSATVLLNASPYIWIDQTGMSGNKFYRALLLP